MNGFVTELGTIDPTVAGDPVILHDFTTAFRQACMKASIYGLLIVFLFLVFIFRGLLFPLLALMPLLVGMVLTVGLMGAAGVNFNLANSVFFPLILGAGVEYAVIILYRWRDEPATCGSLPFDTVKGVTLAALTTTVGFGTLMCSRHQGIYSLGFVSFVGSLSVLLATLFTMPAAMALLSKRRGPFPKAESDIGDAGPL